MLIAILLACITWTCQGSPDDADISQSMKAFLEWTAENGIDVEVRISCFLDARVLCLFESSHKKMAP
jgi:hypothetical protein